MRRLAEPSEKLQIHIPASLKRDIEAAADVAGQTISVFVTRALSAAMQAAGAKQ